MLKTQQYIKEHGLDSLVNDLGIHATKHPKWSNLWHLKYDQIGSPWGNPVVCECRALILDADKDWAVVAHPYNKFFNYGESYADIIDWSTARVYEKVDGTLIVMWHYQGTWNVSTSGTPDGGQFADLFWKQFENEVDAYAVTAMAENFTWMWEYTSPETRIVVPHTQTSIILHGCRELDTDLEFDPSIVSDGMYWPLVKSFNLSSLEDVLAAANVLSPGEQEGFVVVDKDFHRIKIKSPLYVALHHLTGHITTRALLDVARKSEHLELLAYFPQLQQQVEEFVRRLDALCVRIQKTFDNLKDSQSRKIFAISAGQYSYSSILFGLLDGKIKDIKKHLSEISIERLERMI